MHAHELSCTANKNVVIDVILLNQAKSLLSILPLVSSNSSLLSCLFLLFKEYIYVDKRLC